MIARRYRVIGIVQGVGFRAFVSRVAQALALSGWVRNLDDGSVEAWAEGPPEAIATFAARLLRGPSGARVERFETFEADPSGARGFEIRSSGR